MTTNIYEFAFFKNIPLPYKNEHFKLNLYYNKVSPIYRRKQNNSVHKTNKNGFMLETMNINNYKQVLKGQIMSEQETGLLDSLLTKFRAISMEKYNNRNKRKKILLKFLKEPERKLPNIDLSPKKIYKTRYGKFIFPQGYNFDSVNLNHKLFNVLNDAKSQEKKAENVEKTIKRNYSQNLFSKIQKKLDNETTKKEPISKSQSYINILNEEQKLKMQRINKAIARFKKI